MLRKEAAPVTAALLSLGIFCITSPAATVTVGKPNTPCPTPKYSTISDAVKAAASGDVIEICPALYEEQILIIKPLTLRGLSMAGIGRVLLQPASLSAVGNLPAQAVITVMNTAGVTIENLTVDASNNTVSGCATGLSGIHFYNASGTADNNAISGVQLSDPTSCLTLFPGNGFGVHVEKDAAAAGPFRVALRGNSISNYGRNGILVVGAAITADVDGNSIQGVGPMTGTNQFGIFLATGATGIVTGNIISQGNCGALSASDCFTVRSEGVVLRAVGDGTVVDGNLITLTQSGVFLNGSKNARITNNVITNTDALSAIHVQGTTDSLIAGNRIVHVGPVSADASESEEGCGINEVSGAGNSGNTIRGNIVNDAYCGVAYVSADWVESGTYVNTLYNTLNSDDYPDAYPPAVEPGTAGAGAVPLRTRRMSRRID